MLLSSNRPLQHDLCFSFHPICKPWKLEMDTLFCVLAHKLLIRCYAESAYLSAGQLTCHHISDLSLAVGLQEGQNGHH